MKSKMYMIYDEIDMIANPLTCELNIPLEHKIKLSNVNIIYELTKFLYEKISIEK